MKIYKIIGMREQLKKDFLKLAKSECLEAQQIKKGYTNPLVISNIIKCRAKCLKDKIGNLNG